MKASLCAITRRRNVNLSSAGRFPEIVTAGIELNGRRPIALPEVEGLPARCIPVLQNRPCLIARPGNAIPPLCHCARQQ